MKNKTIYLLTFILFSFQFIAAQSNVQAEKIITKILTDAKTNAIKTGFNLKITDKNDPQPQVTSGVFTLKGNKFLLEMDEMKVWFDGKTQWAYVADSKEVSVTEPSEKELSETNPMAILSGYKTRCYIRFSKTKTTANHCIEMIPKVKNIDLLKIDVQVNKTNGNLVSIKLTNKNGSASLLTLSNYQKAVSAPDNIFSFNPAKYKGVVVNDLR